MANPALKGHKSQDQKQSTVPCSYPWLHICISINNTNMRYKKPYDVVDLEEKINKSKSHWYPERVEIKLGWCSVTFIPIEIFEASQSMPVIGQAHVNK